MNKLISCLVVVVLLGCMPSTSLGQKINGPTGTWVNQYFEVAGTTGRFVRGKFEIQLFVYSTGIGGNGLRPLPFRVPATVNLANKTFRAEFDLWDPCLGKVGNNCIPAWTYGTAFDEDSGCDELRGLYWAGFFRADLYVNGLKVDEHSFAFWHDESGCMGEPPTLHGPVIPID